MWPPRSHMALCRVRKSPLCPREDYSNFHKDWTVGGERGGICVCECLCVICVWGKRGVIIDIYYNEVFALSPLPQLL